MIWPDALITELAARRCIIFLGSGASAGSISADGTRNPLTWKLFLDGFRSLVHDHSDDTIIESYITKEKYLEAAEIIYNKVHHGDFTRFIRQELVVPKYSPSPIHKAVLDIDPKIVVTTNYDQIYDNYCTSGSASDGYSVTRYTDSNIVQVLRSPVRLIVKTHGCVSDADNIVLTKSQYFSAKQRYPNFYKVLDALFLTNTILFLGYSLTDPDIQLVLENVNILSPTKHPHYFVTSDDLNIAIKEANKKAYNLDFIEYPTGIYDELNDGVKDLAEAVKAYRIDHPDS